MQEIIKNTELKKSKNLSYCPRCGLKLNYYIGNVLTTTNANLEFEYIGHCDHCHIDYEFHIINDKIVNLTIWDCNFDF